MNGAVRSGLGAIAKAAVLVVGVPLALWRLWFLTALPKRFTSLDAFGSASAWSHVVVLAVAVVWLWASVDLLRQIAGALRRREPIGSSWSARWAVAIASLVFVTSAQSYLHSGRPPTTAAVSQAAPRRPAGGARILEEPSRAGLTTLFPGECLADFSERVLGCADDWPLIAHMNFGRRQPDGTTMLDPVQLRQGWRLAIPAPSDEAASPRDSGSAGRGSLPEFALVGLGTVGVCALARRLALLRRATDATRQAGRRRHRADRVGATAAALAPFADASLIDWLEVANRILWQAFQDKPEHRPDVRLVRVGPDGVELLLGTARRDAPYPFRARREGRWWQLEATGDLSALARSLPTRRLLPSLIPIGDDGLASYLVPITKGRRLAVSGDDESVDATLLGIVACLRAAPWSEALSVELVGIEPPSAEEQNYALAASSIETLGALANDQAGQAGAEAPWRPEPLIVIGRDALGAGDDQVLEAAGAVSGIVVPAARGTEVLAVSKEGAVLHPYGIELHGTTPSRSQLAVIESLFAAARRPAEIVPLPALDRRSDLEAIADKGTVEVRLLCGLPAVTGFFREPFSRDADRVVELLAYLSVHDRQVPIDAIGEALFARSNMPRTARAEHAVGAARAALDRPGEASLIRRIGDDIVLDPAVSCDWMRARGALEAARSAYPGQAILLLDQALALLESTPLAGVVAGYAWWRAESFDEEVAAELVDGAHRRAALALAAGDTPSARAAIDKGRLACPDSELLARDEMAVCDAEGDLSGVRATYSQLEAALERLGGNEPSVETRALFEALDQDH